MPQGVKITAETLVEDGGFSNSSQAFFHSFVAQINSPSQSTGDQSSSQVVGFVLYFFIYSTWEGKAIWMEDLYVKPEFRGKGIGAQLWKAVAEEAITNKCCRIDFYVLDWNKSSIEFYHKKGAIDLTQTQGWHYFRLNRESIEKLANLSSVSEF